MALLLRLEEFMKDCAKCIYFIQYYYFDLSSGLTPADIGRCSADKNIRAKVCPKYQESRPNNMRIKNIPLGQKLCEIKQSLNVALIDLEDLAKDIEININ